MRITAVLLAKAPQITNPIGEREIDLRGLGLQAIECAPLELLVDSFDVMDLSDNNITRIDGFPKMERLSTLIVHNNKCCRFSSHVATALPNLHTIAAHNNQFLELSDLDPFGECKSLLRLSLIGSPVTRKPHYRLYLISRCPSLKLIDFNRVRDVERTEASALFPPQAAARRGTRMTREERQRRRRARLEGDELPQQQPAGAAQQPAEEDLTIALANLNERITNAASVEEIEALEAEHALLMSRKQKQRRVE